MSTDLFNVVVVGVTGLVGSEIVKVLAERQFPVAQLRGYASERTAGGEVEAGDRSLSVDLLERADFEGVDIAFFAAPEQVTAEWAGRATAAGATVIDLSQLYANAIDVPLVVPEVNPGAVSEYDARHIIASPTAAALQLAVVLSPLRDAAGLKRVVVTSYEPVSEAGRAGIDALSQQTIDLLAGRSPEVHLFRDRIAFSLLPQVGEFLERGYTRAEHQLMEQTARLLDHAGLAITATSLRVPLFYGISQSVNVETVEPLTAEAAREVLRSAPGVLLQDDPAQEEYPTPISAIGTDATCVGRIRDDPSIECGLNLWIVGDNVRKGSAINAVAIAEILVRDYL